MKTKNFIAVLSMILIASAILVGSCNAQEQMNYIKVKGVVLNDHKSDVMVFIYDEVNDKWNKVSTKENKSKYNLRLATDKDYKIVFMSTSGGMKTISIKSGDPGMFVEYLDIDFSNGEKYACMYQKNSYRYNIQTEIEFGTIASIE
jgi:hypothetical protein